MAVEKKAVTKNLQLRLYDANPDEKPLVKFVKRLEKRGYGQKQILKMGLEALQEKESGSEIDKLSKEIQELKAILLKGDIKIEASAEESKEEIKTTGIDDGDFDESELP